ncbi:unnamed protein product [Fraxinus pennsylvanica]|uniref:Uncharacterized protein n=1 Tax=Fraxinus pennsylvanica TaxID=56036 RepID=A0AAD2ADA2_9LAMI|nr:unnamed protein product [Fraxinus pennsylvanica]
MQANNGVEAAMKDNLTKARTPVTKGKAKLTMAAMKDNLTKARTLVTKGKAKLTMGKNDFSKAIGAGKEVSVNPSSLDVPKESCESNIPDSEDEIMEILRGFTNHNHELCCKKRRTDNYSMSWLTERESPSPPPPESVLLERHERLRKLLQKQKEEVSKAFQIVREKALALEYRKDFRIRSMSPVFITESKGPSTL